jgi:hypothetical protein
MKLVFDPVWSWTLVVPLIAALLFLVLATYPKRVRHLSKGTRRLLIGLRTASVLMLAFALLRPAIEMRDTSRNSAVMLIVADSSRSMTTPDGTGGVTRRLAVLNTLRENEPEKRSESRSISADSISTKTSGRSRHSRKRPRETSRP